MVNAELKEAAEQVKNVSRTFKAVVALSEAIEKFGGLEQYETDLNARVEAAKGKSAEAEAKLAETLELVADAKGNIGIAEETAASLVADAKSDAEQIIEAARAQAATVVERSNLLILENRDAQDKIEGVLKAVSERESELLALEQKIASVKADALKALE